MDGMGLAQRRGVVLRKEKRLTPAAAVLLIGRGWGSIPLALDAAGI